MRITRENKKIKAIEILKKLDVYKPFIEDFAKEDLVCFFERYAGYWAYQEPDIQQKINELESKHNCLVYAVTHEYTNLGELYNFLIITDYKSEWKTLVQDYGDDKIVFAYVWNKDDEYCSEFGSIAIKSALGGITRVG